MKKKSLDEIGDLQIVSNIVSAELQNQRNDTRNRSYDCTDSRHDFPQLFHYETTVLNYDIPLWCRVRNAVVHLYHSLFHKGMVYTVIVRRIDDI